MMQTDTLPIASNDGALIEAALCRPSGGQMGTQSPKYMFICLPAMGVKAAYYLPLAGQLTAKGHAVLLCDLRGQGTSNRKAPKAKFGYRDIIENDLGAYVRAAKACTPDAAIILLGHSLGGHLSLLYTARTPDVIAAVAIIASGSVWYKAYAFPQNLKTGLGTQSSVLISTVLGYFPGQKLGFGGCQPKAVMRDWARQGRTGRFKPGGSNFDYETGLAKIKRPVFALSIENDTFAPHSAVNHLAEKLKSAEVTRVKYTPSAELASKINHFRWVKHADEIMEHLNEWTDSI